MTTHTDRRATRPGRRNAPLLPAKPTLRKRIRPYVPLADGVTYVYATATIAATWMVGVGLDHLGLSIPGLR